MNTKYKRLFLGMGTFALILTAVACSSLQAGLLTAASNEISQTVSEEVETYTGGIVAGMANPAAVYCQGMGYTLESVERNGGMDADCVFPEGNRCGQWDFLSGRCGLEMTYCARQGGTIQEEGNIGICVFPDGSSCNEFQFFSDACFPGDNPANLTNQDPVAEDVAESTVQIQDFISARDYLAAYLEEEYGIQSFDPWMEADITSPDAAGVNTFRYVSGPLTIVLSAEAAAPYASLYNVQEATNRANGFWWAGTIALDGTIIENEVVMPWSILNPEHARDAVLGYLYANYGISSPGEWLDEGTTQAGNAGISQRYSSGTWLVIVEFEPAAPMVSSYRVSIEESSTGLRWEGNVSGHGEIEQISFVQ